MDGSTKLLTLMPALNLLIQPGRVEPWLRTPLIKTLALLPLRPRGVQHTIEFVLSVHPSSAARNDSTSTGRGSSITHEALNAASRLISSPPAGMDPVQWFNGISPQLLSLLDGEGEPEMDHAAAFIIGFGILGRREFGAPGTSGWNALIIPILARIDPSMGPLPFLSNSQEEPIVTIGAPKVLVTAQELARGLKRLSTLLSSHPHPSLSKRILSPVLLPLWSLSCVSTRDSHASKLIKTFILLLPMKGTSQDGHQLPTTLSRILQNLTFSGRSASEDKAWTYNMALNGDIQIQEIPQKDLEAIQLSKLDKSVESFITLLQELPEFGTEISSLFMDLCARWLAHSGSQLPSIITRIETTGSSSDFKTRLIEAKVMQKLMTEFPDKLVHDSHQVLSLVDDVLSNFLNTSESSEDAVAVALSLLNIVLTSPSFQTSDEAVSRWESIMKSLQIISRKPKLEVSSTAKNLMLVIQFRDSMNDPEDVPLSIPTDRQTEDRKTYRLAMSYLTATDSPPPVRAQGLELISRLMQSDSSVLDIPALLVLFASLLEDSEEYIYLRAIQAIVKLSSKHPKAVMKDLIDRFIDPNEESELDQRLKTGEALLQVIQTNILAFTDDVARSVCEGLLFIAGRRSYRPKKERAQNNQNKLKLKQHEEADEAWGGEVPQLDEHIDLESDSLQDHEAISNIVSGWESTRGSEDLRMRASALSVFGSGMEANISGVGSQTISSAIDLAIHILTLEPEAERGIVRRASILLILSFIKALSTARNEGQRLPFGFVGQSLGDVQRILEYVMTTDNDGLVRQFAKDVVESLQAWQMEFLLPVGGSIGQRDDLGLQELAGLNIALSVGGKQASATRDRPRIEEIE